MITWVREREITAQWLLPPHRDPLGAAGSRQRGRWSGWLASYAACSEQADLPMPSTSKARDTSIATYRARRDFAVTAEPAPGAAVQPGAPIFVVQKHRAHRAGLHWDFRLEHGGVLWSWAVRKGPSLDPTDKRIAVHVEDHPLDYADFQGTIPDGQYGAGTVEIWDRGTWQPIGDPEEGMRKGDLKFVLNGQRLRGAFVLVRMRPRPNEKTRQENWLLIKKHDEQERAGFDATAIEGEMPAPRPARKKTEQSDAPPAPGAVRAGLPKRQSPQLCEPADQAPKGTDWLNEIKFDGYRLLARVEDGAVRLVTRNGHDWTDRLPAVALAVSGLDVQAALLDGELVALEPSGVVRGARRLAALLRVRPALPERLGPASLCPARPQECVGRTVGLARHAALERPHGRCSRRHAARGLPHEARRHHLQAGRRAVFRGPWLRLGEDEVPEPRGIHRARLDATAWQPCRLRRVAPRVPR